MAGGLTLARFWLWLGSARWLGYWLRLSGFAWLWLVAWLRLGCSSAWLWIGLAAAKWLGYWLLASAIGLAAAKWLGYWLLASAIGLAADKGLGFGFWLQLLAWLQLSGFG